MLCKALGNTIVSKKTQLLKASCLMLVTELGSVIVWIFDPEKALSSILVTPSGMTTDSKKSQLENAPSPILTTEVGIVIALMLQ